jgi:hypothetical protein
VAPREHESELASLRPLLHRSPTLFLGYDDYFAWELRDVPASAPIVGGPTEVGVRSEKPWSYGQPFDFDSIQPQTLDRFTYVITSRTTAQSEPPSNFRLVRQTPSFMVWKRTGRTVPRDTLPGEKGSPGAILDCKDKAQRALTRRKGVARVEPAPVGISGPPGPMLPGTSISLPLRLPPGRWSLSMPYLGPQAVTVRVPGLTATLPPNLDRPGPLYSLGQVTIPDGGDPAKVTISIHESAPSRHLESTMQIGYVGNIIAVRPGAERTIPLSRACGRYVDWYRLDDQAA